MFQRIRKIQEFERKHLPFLDSVLDARLVAEIGRREDIRQPLTVKELLLLDLGASATVRRRLKRLVRLSVVHKNTIHRDRRIQQLTVDRGVRKTYARYFKLLASF
ncbi:MAG: hypothetical protein KF771_11970 [Burkholderiales bacterium]|nr:hypothetical protein [Burkholderiales bacterium]